MDNCWMGGGAVEFGRRGDGHAGGTDHSGHLLGSVREGEQEGRQKPSHRPPFIDSPKRPKGVSAKRGAFPLETRKAGTQGARESHRPRKRHIIVDTLGPLG